MYDNRLPNRSAVPPIVKNLIIINVIMALAQQVVWGTFKINLGDVLGLHYFRSELFRPWQPLTHMFMHGDPRDIGETIAHLFFNMFGLWMIGSIMEQSWGPKRFIVFYLICGLGAAACQMGVMSLQYEPVVDSYRAFVANPTLAQFELYMKHHPPTGMPYLFKLQQDWALVPGNLSAPKFANQGMHAYLYGVNVEGEHIRGIMDEGMVGASGAVMGVLFAFAYLFPNLELMLIFLPIPIKAKWFVAIYAAYELFAGVRNGAGDNVAHFAHLGGMLFAFLLLRLWGYRFRNR